MSFRNDVVEEDAQASPAEVPVSSDGAKKSRKREKQNRKLLRASEELIKGTDYEEMDCDEIKAAAKVLGIPYTSYQSNVFLKIAIIETLKAQKKYDASNERKKEKHQKEKAIKDSEAEAFIDLEMKKAEIKAREKLALKAEAKLIKKRKSDEPVKKAKKSKKE